MMQIRETLTNFFKKTFSKKKRYLIASVLDVVFIIVIIVNGIKPAQELIGPLLSPLQPLKDSKGTHEVFGFAPHWTFNKLDNVDFNVLTTLAYFGVEVNSTGDLETSGPGYETFQSKKATEIFKKAHAHGTRVVLTITQMKNTPIKELMDSEEAQARAIKQSVDMVVDRGIDGINVDLEYTGNPGDEYRKKFSRFVSNLTEEMHRRVPSSKVTVSVYASAVKDPKIYDISELGRSADGIFMMAYDFAVAGSDNAIPTAPLYGKNTPRKYWYDVSTAIDDFLKRMPADKLILGVPYYGYNYMVPSPDIKAETYPTPSWRGKARAQTYQIVKEDINKDMDGISDYVEGRDPDSKVLYKAYKVTATNTWRMVFIDDPESLKLKYEFAKSRNLKGVGMWALGFEGDNPELWITLRESFGLKDLADSTIVERKIEE